MLLKEIEHYIEYKKVFDDFYLDLIKKVGPLDEFYIIEKYNMSTIKLNSLQASHKSQELDKMGRIQNLQIIQEQ